MTNNQFIHTCEAIWGSGWRKACREHFGRNRSTVARWANGELPVTVELASSLMCLKEHGKPDTAKKYGTTFNPWNPNSLSKRPAATVKNEFIK